MRKTTTPVTTLANKSTTVGKIPARSGTSTTGDGCDVHIGHIPTAVWNEYYVEYITKSCCSCNRYE